MTAPVTPGQRPQQHDARGYLFQILDVDGLTWLEIGGITEFSVDRSEGEEEAETTTFQDAGQYRSEKMQRGATCELTCRPRSIPTTGAVTPGRKRLEALERQLGWAGVGQFRFRYITDLAWERWDVWVGLGETSGEVNDKAEWECTLHRNGAERWFRAADNVELDAAGTPVPTT